MFRKKTKNENKPKEEKVPVEQYETDLGTLIPYVNLNGHVWHQRGPALICTSCPVQHAFFIGIDKRLMGFDESGSPIIKKV
jgi:hypothetical protein